MAMRRLWMVLDVFVDGPTYMAAKFPDLRREGPT
ncbi:uncharacterized protein G2W53_006407 [Senna tora]|uniref:Uncharacterized protein n=1 Tax=Senna tora TaxID=362788 RepID=A0A834X534_9FABA|nr:uncharacterized protein G2W53_006407 [Senna tora]